MIKKHCLETPFENFLRRRAEDICKMYLCWSNEILCGQVKPNRIIQRIASEKCMSGEGVRTILKREGIYKSAKQPVVLADSSLSSQT